MVGPSLENIFPGLRGQHYEVQSPPDADYNCIAWAAGAKRSWWWPDLDHEDVWPAGVARVETLDAFRDAFATLGYATCDNEHSQAGYEKIAVFALAGVPKHATRQQSSGRWTSKIGRQQDIEHGLHDLEGEEYGSVVLVMRRPMPAAGD